MANGPQRLAVRSETFDFNAAATTANVLAENIEHVL